MNKLQGFVIYMFCLISSVYCQSKGDGSKLTDYMDSLSYIIGRDVGAQLRELDSNIRMSPFSFGVQQGISNVSSLIDSAHSDSIRRRFATEIQEKMQKKQDELASANSRTGEEFLTKNKKRSDVKTTSSWLQYIIVKKGKGPKPSTSDSVKVMYKGMLLDSTVFDSTTSGNPAVLDLNRIIPGLAEGIQLMNVGSTYRFFVPPDLGYGPQGAPPAIPPNATLIFDITLEDIVGKEMKSKL
mgnify:CR=1 FL=1